MNPWPQAFASDYTQARALFLQAAAAAGLPVESHAHPLPGAQGEALAMDVVLDGPANAQHLLIVTSACHGIEGFCGSGVQVSALRDEAWRAKAREQGVAVLYIHALNPHGFSHLRRVTHENVDLNRNFHDFSKPLPVNSAYRGIHALLLPRRWPPGMVNQAALLGYAAMHGISALQTAVSQGQHEFAEGLYFGGTAPTWSNTTLRGVLRRHGLHATNLAWIDLHTGLGPNGHGERIYAGRDEPAGMARARQWWGGPDGKGVTSIYDGSSSSALLTGMMWLCAYEECPQAQFTGIAIEYGTQSLMDVLTALRADHWLHNYPDAPPELAAHIHQQMRDAFYTNTDAWRARIVSQAREALFQAVDGLASDKA